ncbi:MAG TPA: GerMN domain-containing protein [Blastocatellia bacterium]|nr:GerMN domain-containing protein [Blastocatellia bacterium]
MKNYRTLLFLIFVLVFAAGGLTLSAQQHPSPGKRLVWVYLYPANEVGLEGRPISQRAARENALALVPVQREVSVVSPARGALEALIAGPTSDEKTRGLLAPYTEGLTITNLKIINGIARVSLASSCGDCPRFPDDLAVWRFTESLNRVLKQFPNVRRVVICLDGFEDFGELNHAPTKRCD